MSHKVLRQTVTLFAGILFYGGCVFLANTVIARYITPEAYGTYQLVVAIIMFTAFFFDFGLSATGARVLAITKSDTEERSVFSNLFYVFLGICLVYLAILFFGQWPVRWIFGLEAQTIFSSVLWLAFLYPFFYFFPSVFQGTNHIARSALYYFLQGGVFLGWVLVGVRTVSAAEASLMFYGGFAAATLVIILLMRPAVRYLDKTVIRHILSENKRYGFHLYIGNIVERTSFHLDKLLIAFFIGNEQVGYYALGMMLIALITTFSMAFNQSLFKRFASSTIIPAKVFYYNWIWISVASVGLFAIHKPLIRIMFGEAYMPVTHIMIPLIIAAIFQSLYQPYQAYLASNGIKEIKTGSYLSAIINVVFNLTLIPFYGYMGAAIATALSYLTWFVFLKYLYHKTIRA